MTSTPTPTRSERSQRPVNRDEVVQLVAVAVLGLLWGAAWQRTAALTDIAAVAPILLVVVGPGLLVVFLGLRIATGRFAMRITGYGAIVAVVAALVGNVLTPGLAPSVTVPGHLTGTLDGAAVDGSGATACTWGPGRTQVNTVTYDLASPLTAQVPAGLLTIDLTSGAVFVGPSPVPAQSPLPAQSGASAPTLPLRLGTGPLGEGDRSSGTVTLDPAQGALVAGQLSWTCQPAPAG